MRTVALPPSACPSIPRWMTDTDTQKGGTGGFPPMPPHVRARIERRLNRVARRLLELDNEAGRVPHLPTGGRLDSDGAPGVSDKATPLGKPLGLGE
jgi:hypothetical protein